MTLVDLASLQTEGRNPRTTRIDQVSTLELCQLINEEDASVIPAVANCLPTIAGAIDAISDRVRQGGRVIYVGAGTSGRQVKYYLLLLLGVVDASEIPPTFSAPHGQFIALMAGGDAAMRVAQEGAEDSTEDAAIDLEPLQLDSKLDSLIGIAASGRTPYVLACLAYAKKRGCVTIGVACSHPSAMSTSGIIDFMINAMTGPEVITGSTRMKAGTATKLVLNMLSTGVMIRIGKTYGNMMVDLKASNLKLEQRSRNILRKLSGPACPSTDQEIDSLLSQCGGSVKIALATLALGSTLGEARLRLDAAGGRLSEVLKQKNDDIGPDEQRRISTSLSSLGRPLLVLYIDGGGTKCAAVAISSDGKIGEGEAGPCNVTDVGLETSIASIKLATQRALDAVMQSESGVELRDANFTAVWAGFAGYDRPEVKSRIDPALSALFCLSLETGALKLTNDIDVLASAASATERNCGESSKSRSVAVLIAGTGSVATRYTRDDVGYFMRTGRSGGWGHFLGDDGAGFDIGKQAIRIALYDLDVLRNTRPSHLLKGKDLESLRPLSKKVLEYFQLYDTREGSSSNYDLLSAVLMETNTSSNDETPSLNSKSRIAQVAKLVLESASSSLTNCTTNPDSAAQDIISGGIQALFRIMKPVLTAPFDSASSTLILSGSLLTSENEVYRVSLLSELVRNGVDFGDVQIVKSPARVGAKALAKKYLGIEVEI
ncbi:N-acetylmuramic acid 6-phosphate etherase [Polytolypa hystricis UAMH7299]|uniref:N-acetyl-D-glucosamine kinase n=1 Tax=Polytolypa hystricis (strain UAMH7299) TaxID=1447883 RepID=A0A2B7Y313_POLH7|nr:N-acetylmuramic acid 6-phosphate etherase [Polytolypa hystricis UAMH7299]